MKMLTLTCVCLLAGSVALRCLYISALGTDCPVEHIGRGTTNRQKTQDDLTLLMKQCLKHCEGSLCLIQTFIIKRYNI